MLNKYFSMEKYDNDEHQTIKYIAQNNVLTLLYI